ncbi:winged helix-turn-helix domain-containing protein [Sphingomonas sp. DT-204]|uniref:winged helix-turn-helix domain-containing protein n=1 Tax=Sphingomonas sp. DT-204 TaxID=3396166 RepID=UPI003F1A1D5B
MDDMQDGFRVNLAREPEFTLGGAEVRPSTREIVLDGTREMVEPRVMQVLVALARRRGEVVSRDELIHLCWEGRVVGEDAINRCLAKVRRLTERMRGITLETVPRVGYRLSEVPTGAPVTVEGGMAAWFSQRAGPIGIGLALLALGIFFFGYRLLPRDDRISSPTFAVLPFTSLNSGEEVHLFGKSIGAATAAALNRVGLPLASTAPLPARADNNPADVGRALGADYVVTGTVRQEGGVIRAFARVDQVEGGITVYSRLFEIPVAERHRLPDYVAGGVAGAITPAIPFINREADPRARAGVLRALLSEDARGGLDAARETLAAVPPSGVAQLAFALRSHEVFSHRDTPELERRALIGPARAAAARARELLPRFGESYLPACLLSATATPAQCEDLLRQGLAADSRSPWLPTHLGTLLSEAGRLDEAGALRASAHAADPFQSAKAGLYLYHLELSQRAGQPDTAPLIRAGQLYWRRNPIFIELRFRGLVAGGRMEEAAGLLQDPVAGPIIEPPGREQPIRTILVAHRTRAPADIDRARSECDGDRLFREPAIAACLTGLSAIGDLDAAFALAERIYPERSRRSLAEAEESFVRTGGNGYSRAFLFGDAAAPMRSDPRFIAIAERTGMLDYWIARRQPDFCTREPAPVCARIRRGKSR